MAVRLKDIALDLGVSVVTVSKVLRGHADIGPETRERVLQRMKELNYRPNMLARGLAGGRTYTVGLVVPDLVHPFFAEFAKVLATALRSSDRVLLLASSEDDPEIERQEIRTLGLRGVDVLVLASCRTHLADLPDLLGDFSRPCLLFDRDDPALDVSFIGTDDLRAGELAAEHLLSSGHRRIAHIGGKHTGTRIHRAQGFVQALLRHGTPVPPVYMVQRDRVEETGDLVGSRAMTELLALSSPPDAVFCYNDLTAVGAMEAVFRAGLRVPEDVAVLGCGNFPYADYLRVPLSSIDQDTPGLGRVAAEMAVELSSGAKIPNRRIRREPSVVPRQSTTPKLPGLYQNR